MKKIILLGSLIVPLCTNAIDVDYSVIAVPNESALNLICITNKNDCVAMPQVIRKGGKIDWLTNRIINVSPKGNEMAYISARDGKSNIFIKDLHNLQGTTQRTNCNSIIDFNYSTDGEKICFAEDRGNGYQIFLTDAHSGFMCQQYTHNGNDLSPIMSKDNGKIYFARTELQGTSIWSCNVENNNMLTSYAIGFNPQPFQNNNIEQGILCTRINEIGNGELWLIDLQKGTEQCILSDINHSFTSPMVSPDGKWIVCVGSSKLPVDNKGLYYDNTDIYVVKIDGTELKQLTYHAADDLSPAWSPDGRYIYFISQRGSADATANVWRMDFYETL